MGAEWCGPCQKMVEEVWVDPQLKGLLENKDIHLQELDATKEKEKRYFSFFKINVYPTLILIERNKPGKELFRVNGYHDVDKMSGLIRRTLK